MKSRSTYVLAAILAATLGVAGCDDDNDNPNSPGTPASPSPSPSESPSPTPEPSATPAPPGDNEGDPAAFVGRVQRAGAEQIKVGGRFVSAAPGADLTRNGQPATLADYEVGDIVRVRGTFLADATVAATMIRTENGG